MLQMSSLLPYAGRGKVRHSAYRNVLDIFSFFNIKDCEMFSAPCSAYQVPFRRLYKKVAERLRNNKFFNFEIVIRKSPISPPFDKGGRGRIISFIVYQPYF